jgi:hypothetical protein
VDTLDGDCGDFVLRGTGITSRLYFCDLEAFSRVHDPHAYAKEPRAGCGRAMMDTARPGRLSIVGRTTIGRSGARLSVRVRAMELFDAANPAGERYLEAVFNTVQAR